MKITAQQIKGIFKITIGVIVLLLLFWLGGEWLRNKTIKVLGGYSKKDIEITIDTISRKTDTVWYEHEKVITEVDTLSDKKEIIEYKYMYKYKENGKPEQEKTEIIPLVYSFENAISDTLIEGKIFTIYNPFSKKIIKQTLDYKPKFPIIVKEYITIEKTIKETISNEDRPKIGLGATGSTNSYIGPVGAYQFKNGMQLQGAYEFNLGSIETNRPKNIITLSLIKLF